MFRLRTVRILACAASMAMAPYVSRAAADCRLGTTVEGTPSASLQHAADVVDAMFGENPHLSALPEARLRNEVLVMGGVPRAMYVHAKAYGPSTWEGTCGLVSWANLAGEVAGISASFNTTDPLLEWPFRDELSRAAIAPQEAGSLQGYPLYRVGPMYFVVLTADGVLPWAPLSTEEFLAFRERELRRRMAEFDATKAQTVAAIDTAAIREAYETMKQFNPAAAEEYLENMRAFLKEAPGKMEQQFALGDASIQKDLDFLMTYRSGIAPDQLRSQARAGMGQIGLTASEAAVTQLLVKDNPEFHWDTSDPNRVQLLILSRGDTFPHWNEGLRAAFENLDYDVLGALVR